MQITFGQVLEGLKNGKRYYRKGWNGKNMFIYFVAGSQFNVNREPMLSIFGKDTIITYRPHIDMCDADGACVPWLASQTDILAADWAEFFPEDVQAS